MMKFVASVFAVLLLSIPASAEVICNFKTEKTNLRQGPSAKNFEIAAKLTNGHKLEVLERVTNSEGFEYLKVKFKNPDTGKSAVAFVYHEAVEKEECGNPPEFYDDEPGSFQAQIDKKDDPSVSKKTKYEEEKTQYVIAEESKFGPTGKMCKIALPSGVIGQGSVFLTPPTLSDFRLVRLLGDCDEFNKNESKADTVVIYLKNNYMAKQGGEGKYFLSFSGASKRGKFDGKVIIRLEQERGGYYYSLDDTTRFFKPEFATYPDKKDVFSYFDNGRLFSNKEAYRASLDTDSPLLNLIDISVKTTSEDAGGNNSTIFLEYNIKPLDVRKLSKFKSINLIFKVKVDNRYRGGKGIFIIYKDHEFTEQNTISIQRSDGFATSGKVKLTEVTAQIDAFLTGKWRLEKSDMTVNIVGIEPK
jgi:hypothetical protein